MVLLTCSYRNHEFVRVGYYVNIEYTDPELKENPPLEPDFAKVCYPDTKQHLVQLFLHSRKYSFHCVSLNDTGCELFLAFKPQPL